MKIKVLIADDNSFIREGLRIILGTFEQFDVIATVSNGQEAVDYCRQHEVDVALLDVRMPIMNGVEATRLIVQDTSTRPIILTTFDDDEYIVDAIRYGAKGYMLKNNEPERICDAIRSVFAGNNVLQDVVMGKLASSMLLPRGEHVPQESQQDERSVTTFLPTHSPPDKPRSALTLSSEKAALEKSHDDDNDDKLPFDERPFTDRELSVMSLVAKGYSNKEIAKEIFISEGTTANYITSILNKTGLEHRTQIAIYYLTGRTR
ncbi:DNA-binding NarL/FixJ family response regulator [Paenibacillus shirakamiensis]|uniref:DNA-binding NarL/FixJ family response regulator n=1 Tax=Paenibacillus shirakamiensis TaxID=1265935 RepID=A0ABS4JI77_9BACL|nr:response regulator transcription factor [Paenibacillus shirakamiensis]MBP2001417.1 DNA-binding NarL/FixJ family response regulator [Paenibacillus shirakamiensis]